MPTSSGAKTIGFSMTQLGRFNTTFAYTGVCGTGGTDTLILGRMVGST